MRATRRRPRETVRRHSAPRFSSFSSSLSAPSRSRALPLVSWRARSAAARAHNRRTPPAAAAHRLAAAGSPPRSSPTSDRAGARPASGGSADSEPSPPYRPNRGHPDHDRSPRGSPRSAQPRAPQPLRGRERERLRQLARDLGGARLDQAPRMRTVPNRVHVPRLRGNKRLRIAAPVHLPSRIGHNAAH